MPLQAIASRSGGRGWALGGANTWLLIASTVFYAWGEVYLVWVMIGSALLNFAGGQWCAPGRRGRVVALAMVVAGNLALLAFFKYSGFIVANVNAMWSAWTHDSVRRVAWAGVALPLGISFYTFHGISYVVDVWRGKVPPCRSVRDFLCYSTLFPQLVAGPIVRYAEVGQYLQQRRVTLADISSGTRRFVIGLGKKVLIANQVSILADAVFALRPDQRTADAAWMGVVAYALQIYFDFSGYSDMAIGLGRMFGFPFPENFNYPYIARSVREFWQRWHMTLSRFFRDYLYIPMGGNRHGGARTALNLILVFALCGLWHGASWNFVAWGLFHGVFLVLERVLRLGNRQVPSWLRPLGHVYALAAILLGWVFFRCDSWQQAMDYFHALAGIGAPQGLVAHLSPAVLTPSVGLAILVGVLGCTAYPARMAQRAIGSLASPLADIVELTSFSGVLVLSLLFVGVGSHNPFIYYRF